MNQLSPESERNVQFHHQLVSVINGELPTLRENCFAAEPLNQLSQAVCLVDVAHKLQLSPTGPYESFLEESYQQAGGLGSLEATRILVDYLGRRGDFDQAIAMIEQATLLPPADASSNPFQEYVYHYNKANELDSKSRMYEILGVHAVHRGRFDMVQVILPRIEAISLLSSDSTDHSSIKYPPQPGESLYFAFAKYALAQEDTTGFVYWDAKITSRILRSEMNEYLITHFLQSNHPNYADADTVFQNCANLAPHTLGELHVLAASLAADNQNYVFHHLDQAIQCLRQNEQSDWQSIELLCRIASLASHRQEQDFIPLRQTAIRQAQKLHQNIPTSADYEWSLASQTLLQYYFQQNPKQAHTFLQSQLLRIPFDGHNHFSIRCQWALLNYGENPQLLAHFIVTAITSSGYGFMFEQTKREAGKLAHLAGELIDHGLLIEAFPVAANLHILEDFAVDQDPHRTGDEPNALTPILLAKNENRSIVMTHGNSDNPLDFLPYTPHFPHIYSKIAVAAVSQSNDMWQSAYRHIPDTYSRILCLSSIAALVN